MNLSTLVVGRRGDALRLETQSGGLIRCAYDALLQV